MYDHCPGPWLWLATQLEPTTNCELCRCKEREIYIYIHVHIYLYIYTMWYQKINVYIYNVLYCIYVFGESPRLGDIHLWPVISQEEYPRHRPQMAFWAAIYNMLQHRKEVIQPRNEDSDNCIPVPHGVCLLFHFLFTLVQLHMSVTSGYHSCDFCWLMLIELRRTAVYICYIWVCLKIVIYDKGTSWLTNGFWGTLFSDKTRYGTDSLVLLIMICLSPTLDR